MAGFHEEAHKEIDRLKKELDAFKDQYARNIFVTAEVVGNLGKLREGFKLFISRISMIQGTGRQIIQIQRLMGGLLYEKRIGEDDGKL